LLDDSVHAIGSKDIREATIMTITVQIPSELEKKLQTEAAEHGVTAAEYARMLLERILASTARSPSSKTPTSEEWLRAFTAWMDNYDPTLPPLSDEAISREEIYGGRS